MGKNDKHENWMKWYKGVSLLTKVLNQAQPAKRWDITVFVNNATRRIEHVWCATNRTEKKVSLDRKSR